MIRDDRLGTVLEHLVEEAALVERVRSDPVELPHRYQRREDIEVAALLAASLAYGRVEGFKPKVEQLLGKMGSSPADWVSALTPKGAQTLLSDFVYRFNVGTDVAVLLSGAGKLLRQEGTLEGPIARALAEGQTLHAALRRFIETLRDVPRAELRRRLGEERGLHHLLPSPLGPGAAKRLNLFLRWMVRGPDAVDFGLWRRIPKSALLIPLDTHIHRMAKHLGLTRRNDLSWKTAQEVTGALHRIDPLDPVRFDFALCHFGMSGRCPQHPNRVNCEKCPLIVSCRSGRARTRAP